MTFRLNISITAKSYAASLEPFLDQNGVFRAGGRLGNTALPYDLKFSILLHYKSSLVKLFLKHIHEAYCHASHSFVLGLLLRKY